MDVPIYKVKGIKKQFGLLPVLKGLDLEILQGESIVVIGQSGCGKSVLLKHLVGLMQPDEGNVIFDGQDLGDLSFTELGAVRTRMGMLFQSAALFDSLTVGENVGLGLKESRKYKKAEIKEIAFDKLEMVGLTSAVDKYPSELSGGMRKRVGLARAIATEPEVLLYDEPTTGLDPITGDMINDLIVNLNEKLNVTSIAVTHDMKSAYKIASRIVMLYEGRVEFDGTPEETRNTQNGVVRQFINGLATGPIKVG
jgi:phospholipid/cholesterol/gamma-HCH transport system ATP-binding protein